MGGYTRKNTRIFFACTEKKPDWLVLMDESAFIFYFRTRSGISSKSYNFFGFAKQKDYNIQNDIIRSYLGAVPPSSKNKKGREGYRSFLAPYKLGLYFVIHVQRVFIKYKAIS